MLEISRRFKEIDSRADTAGRDAMNRASIAGFALGTVLSSAVFYLVRRWFRKDDESVSAGTVAETMADLIGSTPLLRIKSLSDLTQCNILAKVEFTSIGGTSKVRSYHTDVSSSSLNRILCIAGPSSTSNYQGC